ncbi:MAG: alpha-galactosidase [Subtercola sp.]|nr:alpha-galactosidase [Subtercola sp.]
MTNPSTRFIHLSAAGVSVVLDVAGGLLPEVLHWGAALGELTIDDVEALALAARPPATAGGVDLPIRVSVVPESHTGFVGRPGIAGHRNGTGWSPKFVVDEVEVVPGGSGAALVGLGAALVTVTAQDDTAGLGLVIEIELLPSGLLRTRATLQNTGVGLYTLDELNLALPLPARAREILDFAGRWTKERVPQRRPLVVGIHDREGRRGRTGADAATVLSVGVPGFGFGSGEVWGLHVGFSGNHRHYAERLSTGQNLLGGGELLLPGEIRLATGERYSTPWLHGAWGDGLDDQAGRFHRHLRSRPGHPRSPRPVTFNVWEAVYFDHDLTRLLALVDGAAALGVERFVLDDGWFHGRRDDTAGLGDWVVDGDVWPEGLHPLVDAVVSGGMQFGLWVEPEMVNLDSDLARDHPDWLMGTGSRMPVPARHQQVLNLGLPGAYDHVLGQLAALLAEYPIGYLKWDHNRDLVDAGSRPGGEAAVHAQTLAVYRLMAELKLRFPGLEIESCSAGGGRVDLGIADHVDRFWVSDSIDPHERQQLNRWSMQLLPAELLGSHLASAVSHTTGRAHRLGFRAATALYGHFGVEWDLLAASSQESAELAAWIELYKTRRELLHTGTLVRVDVPGDDLWIYGSVSADQRDALFFLAQLERPSVSPGGRFVLRGLRDDLRYDVRRVLVETGDADRADRADGIVSPPWFGGVVMTGRALAVAGLQLPTAHPDTVILLDVTAVDVTAVDTPIESGRA